MRNQPAIKGGQPCEEATPGRTEIFLRKSYDRLKLALSALPEATPTEEQRQQWLKCLEIQRLTYKQRQAQQFALNNKIYEQALRDTPVDVKALNDDLDTLFATAHPYQSTPAPAVIIPDTPAVIQKSDAPAMVEYTKNKQENVVLNNTAAELIQARHDSIVAHATRQRERKKEAAAEKENQPKSRREKR